MPIYEYECTACKTRFERSQRFSDPPVTECPECGGKVRRVLFPAGIVFKGSGWYKTDSRSATPATTAGSAANGAAGGENKADSGASETAAKSESAPPAKSDKAPSSSSGGTSGTSGTSGGGTKST
jgi:putative FmdB family regulatory protein